MKVRGTDKYDARIEMMIRQASYGGQLVIYFRESIDCLIGDYDENGKQFEPTTIKFTSPVIAIIDTSGGSGDDCWLEGHEVSMPLVRNNLFVCKCVKYSYTYEVCGMVSDWCDSTVVHWSEKPLKTKSTIEPSNLNDAMERQAALDQIYKAGGCTSGDMNITRHRDVKYINDFPCGNKCTKCGTFWVD